VLDCAQLRRPGVRDSGVATTIVHVAPASRAISSAQIRASSSASPGGVAVATNLALTIAAPNPTHTIAATTIPATPATPATHSIRTATRTATHCIPAIAQADG